MSKRNIPLWLWTHFKNSFGSFKQKTELVGKDHLGNTYFEKFADPQRNLKGARYVETADGDQFTAPDVPVEWEAWLRKKRKDPPTEYEISRNHALKLRTIQRAHDADERLKILAGNTEDKKKSPFEDIAPGSSSSNFPEYPEYETIPGKKKEEK